MKKIGIIISLLYMLALLQMSFFVHISPQGFIPNFVVICVVLVSIFRNPESYASVVAALFGGLLIDIFSGGFIGVWSVILLSFSIGIRIVLENYVRISISQKF